MRGRRSWATLQAFCLLLGLMLGCTHAPKTAESTPIRVGASLSLTGGSALWGQSELAALEMEAERVNAAGGVLGRKLELIAYDNKAEQAEAVNVARRLVAKDVCAIIGVAQSGVAIATAGVSEEAGVLLLSTTATNPRVTVPEAGAAPRRHSYRACFIDPYQGEVAARFAFEDLGVRKAAILYDVGSDYSQGLSEYFAAKFTELGGELVAKEAFRSEELEFKAPLALIAQSQPELLFIPTMQKEAGLVMKQAAELGFAPHFLGGDGWASSELVELGGAATEGAFFVNIASAADPKIAEWVEAYRAKTGEEPVMPNPVLAVDALRLLLAAIEATETTEPAKLTAWLETAKDVPALSGALTIDPVTHDPVGRSAVIETVKDGRFVFYKAVAAS